MCQHRPRSRTLMPPRTRMLVPGGCNLLPARHSNVESAAEQPPNTAAGAGVWRHAPLRPYILLHFICTILLNKKYAEYAEYAETQKSSTEPFTAQVHPPALHPLHTPARIDCSVLLGGRSSAKATLRRVPSSPASTFQPWSTCARVRGRRQSSLRLALSHRSKSEISG